MRSPESALLVLWLALLGIQLPVPLANFRFSPSDVALAVILGLLAWRRRSWLSAVVRSRTPLTWLLASLALALVAGAFVAILRTGVLVQEAWLNKGVGSLVLAAIVLAVRAIVRTPQDVRRALATLFVTGSVVVWVAALSSVLGMVVLERALTARFDGFLMNPSANAVFIAVLLIVQLAFVCEGAASSLRRWLQYSNAIGLAFLLLATLSRTTWLAAIGALIFIAAFCVRRSRLWPAGLALLLIVFAGQPLAAALGPALDQISRGQLPTTLRETRPIGTLPPRIGGVASPLAPTAPPPTPTAPPPTPTAPPPTPTAPLPTPLPASEVLRLAQLSAADRHGATDRLALDTIALRLWLSDPIVTLTGIGLGVFFQISPYTSFGTNLIIHSTYVWLPVEMGILGILVLVMLTAVVLQIARAAYREDDRVLVVAIVGPLILFSLWVSVNEGLYQRTLWLMLALGSVVAWPPRLSRAR